ncbi:PAS domain-containing protein [uncultured Aureimonas sp.]|uniref:PAS domain-containing protein n=1 Tax=uncultured Aureimonas sp. TaxID=1604662 RepID=UPI0025D78DB0|nr:PAS domain-containing protein [uncultured Aureimonas sp.]
MPDRFEENRIRSEIGRASLSNAPFASAVRATRMPMVITDPKREDNPIVFVNAAFQRLTGYSREECVGRNCRFLQGPGTSREDVAAIREGVAAGVTIEREILNYRRDGSTFWNHVLISPVFDEDGDAVFFFASQFDVTPERNRLAEVQRDRDNLEAEIERRLADLPRAEDRLRFTLEAGRLGAWTLDLDTMRLVASTLCKRNFGRDPAETFTYDDLAAAIHPEDRERWAAAVREAVTGADGELEIEYRTTTPSGAVRWIEVRGQVGRDGGGTPTRMAGVSLDITDRRTADEHRNLLANELEHRVKNTLANVQSIVVQTLRAAPSLEAGTRTLVDRIQAYAAAHDVLVKEGWVAANLVDVVEGALRPFRNGGAARVQAAGPDVRLRTRAATTMALAIHELATNAVKYGALSNEDGVVAVDWEIAKGPESSLLFRWRETGGPTVASPTGRGFGSRMLERALPAETNGVARLEYHPVGVTFTLEARLADIAEPDGLTDGG